MSSSSFSFNAAAIRDLDPNGKLQWFSDTKQPGLQVCVLSSGAKRWYFYARVHGKPKRQLIGKYPAVTLQEARSKVRELHVQRDRGKLSIAGRAPTFAEAYAERKKEAIKKGNKSIDGDDRRFAKLTELHPRRLNHITRADIRDLHGRLGDNGPYEANRYLALIRHVFNHAIRELDFPGPNPCAGVRPFPEQSRKRYLKEEELKRLYAALEKEDQLYRDLVYVLLYTGARVSSVLTMRWDDLDLELATWGLPDSKGGAVVLPLVEQVLKILRRRLAVGKSSEFVFPSPRRPWTHLKGIKGAWKRIAKRAALVDVRIHDLRRTFGSYQASEGSSPILIGASLGHKPGSPATSVYARHGLGPVRDSAQKAVSRMQACRAEEEEARTQNS